METNLVQLLLILELFIGEGPLCLLGSIKYDKPRQDGGCNASVQRSIHQVSFRRALAGSIAKEIPDLSSWTGRSGSSGRVVSPTACLALDP